MSKVVGILTGIAVSLAASTPVFAGLSKVGPYNAPVTSNGFPKYYTDANGVTLDLPIPPAGDGLVAPTMIYAPLTGASNDVARRAGFDTEAFYFNARPDPKTFATKYGKIVAVMGLEASYVNLQPKDGDQMVFARLKFKIPLGVAGTYTIFHPWGSETVSVIQTDIQKNKGITFVRDIGAVPGWAFPNPDGTFSPMPAPGGFATVLQTANTMSTFLRQVSPLPPDGWIGDGVTPATVTGSPIGYNKIRIEGPDPNLDGKNHNFVETSLFVVAGHALSAPSTPLSVDRVTCSHITSAAGDQEYVDLFVTTDPGASVSVVDANAPGGTLLASTPVSSPTGKFYKSFVGTTKSVSVTAVANGMTAFTKTVPVVDYVNIVSAQYSLKAGSLTVTATSSDFVASAPPGQVPTLTLTGFGPMNLDATTGNYTLTPPLNAPLPPTVSVVSSVGGSDTTPVAIVP
jgi:hypothetical protein